MPHTMPPLTLALLLVACADPPPPPATADDRAAERDALVRKIAAKGIASEPVLDAVRAVRREAFVPGRLKASAYLDTPLPIGEGQTISQPYVVARMTEAADITRGERVLEVGTGSGYQAAVLAELTPHVFSIEIVEPLAERAAKDLAELGYDGIALKTGDGYAGWPEHAPFDAILVTAAPPRVPPPLVEQLAAGGKLVIPVGEEGGVQQLQVHTKAADGSVRTELLDLVRFVPMTGRAREWSGPYRRTEFHSVLNAEARRTEWNSVLHPPGPCSDRTFTPSPPSATLAAHAHGGRGVLHAQSAAETVQRAGGRRADVPGDQRDRVLLAARVRAVDRRAQKPH